MNSHPNELSISKAHGSGKMFWTSGADETYENKPNALQKGDSTFGSIKIEWKTFCIDRNELWYDQKERRSYSGLVRDSNGIEWHVLFSGNFWSFGTDTWDQTNNGK